MKITPIFMSIDELKTFIPMLYAEWLEKKGECKYPVFVEELFKDLNKLIKSKKIKDYIKVIQCNNGIGPLRMVVNNPSCVDIDFILLNTATDDKIKTFIKYSDEMDDIAYWEELRSLYQLQDHVKINYELLTIPFLSQRPLREHLNTEEENGHIKSLPDKITIYRGCSEKEINSKKYGISWTLDNSIAETFANRLNLKSIKANVVSIEIPKHEIIGYFTDREEEEIIYIAPYLKSKL